MYLSDKGGKFSLPVWLSWNNYSEEVEAMYCLCCKPSFFNGIWCDVWSDVELWGLLTLYHDNPRPIN